MIEVLGALYVLVHKLQSDRVTIYKFIGDDDFESTTRKDKWNSGDVLQDEFEPTQGI